MFNVISSSSVVIGECYSITVTLTIITTDNSLLRYMFRNTERTNLQEIGPRFTLKLRWLKKGMPAVGAAGTVAQKLMTAAEEDEEEAQKKLAEGKKGNGVRTPGSEEFEWMWKVGLSSKPCALILTDPTIDYSQSWRLPDASSSFEYNLYQLYPLSMSIRETLRSA